MPRIVDIVLVIIFVSYFLYCTMMALVFGQRSGISPYAFHTFTGLFLIVTSVFINKKKIFLLTRLSGIVLVCALLYWDRKTSAHVTDSGWDIFVSAIAYFPAFIVLVFVLTSLARARTLSNSAKIVDK